PESRPAREGAVDSIVDIVGAAAAFADLAADKIYASALHTGCGTVRCAHGELPVPAPATLEVLAGAPIYARGIEGELLTPTGAAILATVAEFSSLPTMTVQRTGYGAGQKDLPIANVLRVIVGETDTQSDYHRGTVTVLETTIDDMNPEFYGHVMEQLLKAGAVDVTMAPIHMKKNRPGILLTVLVHAPHEEAVVTTLFNETTTLGMRRTTAEKLMLARRQQTVETHYGPVRIKIGEMDSDVRNASPEYEDCASLARQHNVPIKTIYMMALTAYTKTITT
ncbi:MAG: nickel pincer cofactor biosynthesis protein LarC, partial [Firmicutes bacterium]|nr:nickel pincer cofactor biosynthesis protein LarC [Bacillota bacterium]